MYKYKSCYVIEIVLLLNEATCKLYEDTCVIDVNM